MIRTILCTENQRLRKDLSADDIARLLRDDDSLLWLDVEHPTSDEIKVLAEEFSIHPLAIEDVSRQHLRPKIDTYDNTYFLVYYDIDYSDTDHLIDEHELNIFVGKNYLITLHDEPIEEIAEVAERFHRNIAEIEHGIGVLLYSLLDTIVDHYFPVIDAIGERIEELESRVFEQGITDYQQRLQDIFLLKRELIDLRRVIAPERDAIATLARGEIPLVTTAAGVYFQDLYDHILRVTDSIDIYRDLLGGVLDSYLSLNSNRLAESANTLNVTMKTLTSFSIILMSVTLIAGIYGMNFVVMPELQWTLGYPFALGLMLAVAFGLYTLFKRSGWL